MTVGTDTPRIDARAKAIGETKFAGDLVIPGMVYGKLIRSPFAAAKITRIDARAAKALPGVITVMTGDDVLDIDPYYGHAIKDRPLIAIDRVRFAGEPVVAIAAETPEIAADAADLVEIDYEPMEAVLSIDEALAEDAPHLHVTELLRKGLFHGLGEFKLDPGNYCYHHQFGRGDLDAAFAEADIVVEGSTLSRRSINTPWKPTPPSPSGITPAMR
ncbi:MAG: hypothetical protein R2855_00490 [Thermomicrobiales bacterium]